MPVFVKSYMRNGSSVRAYSRSGKVGRRYANYTPRSINQTLTSRAGKKRHRRINLQSRMIQEMQVRKGYMTQATANMFPIRPSTRRKTIAVQVRF